jgi:hypothetical protein
MESMVLGGGRARAAGDETLGGWSGGGGWTLSSDLGADERAAILELVGGMGGEMQPHSDSADGQGTDSSMSYYASLPPWQQVRVLVHCTLLVLLLILPCCSLSNLVFHV